MIAAVVALRIQPQHHRGAGLTDRGAIAGCSPIIRRHAIRGVGNVSRPNRDNVDAVKSHLELRSEGATTVAFDTTIIEISLLR